METALTIYGGVAFLTAAYGYRTARPATWGEWLGLAAISAFWPLFLVWVAAGEARDG